MDKLFYPDSIVIIGLSAKENNLSRLILGNLIRWGYSGRLFGLNPGTSSRHVDGIKMYRSITELPIVPDLAVTLLPAKFIPEVVRSCGEFGIRYMAIPAGGFNESGEDGEQLAEQTLTIARQYNIRFIGPNGLTVVNTANGLCLPFPPLYCPPRGDMSIITQSGGLGLFLWNMMADEHIGLAKFASIGNKLDLNEADFLRYFAQDPDTKIICLYVESITNGRALIEAAKECDKPVVLYKANTTSAGSKAAMSHTAAISNNNDILDAALERAGIIRIDNFNDFISVTKAFKLPPMRGNRIMAMSPAGGFSVIMADLCEKAGFEFADPGREFYEEVARYGHAGIIRVSNPLDMGDIYDPKATVDVFHQALHNDNVDGGIYINQWPRMPAGDDIFTKMFHTDLSQEIMGAVRSSGKPLGVCLFGPSRTITKIKNNLSLPLFNNPEEMVRTMKIQQLFYARKSAPPFVTKRPVNIDTTRATAFTASHRGILGEEVLELFACYGIPVAPSTVAHSAEEAAAVAAMIGYPVVMKVVSPDAIHKSEAGGVLLGLHTADEVREGYERLRGKLASYNSEARFDGVRIMTMAGPGHDMFIGAKADDAFGPVVFFGYGGIYIEVFKDTEQVLCPSNHDEIARKLKRLNSYAILNGARGGKPVDIEAYIDLILRVSWLMADFPQLLELDINPARVLADGTGVLALDGRALLS